MKSDAELQKIYTDDPSTTRGYVIHYEGLQRVWADGQEVAGHDIAEEIRRELVCCDVYERHHEHGLPEYAAHHALCYWGEAAARLAEGSGEDA